MEFWWSNEAIRKYLGADGDVELKRTFDSLIAFIAEEPNRGARLDELMGLQDDPHHRAGKALAHMNPSQPARIVLATVPPPKLPAPRPLMLAVLVHSSCVPDGVQADHSIILLGHILRQAPPTVR